MVFQPDEKQIATLRAELDTLTPALAEARKVVDMCDGRYIVAWALDPLTTLLPHAEKARITARLLKLDAINRVHNGDPNGALDSCRAILNVGRSLGDEPLLITQLVRVAIQTVSLRTLEHILAVGEPSDEALAAMQRLLEDEEAQALLRAALRGERATLNDLYARLASGELKKMGQEEVPPAIQWLWGEWMVTYARGVVLEEMNEALAIADAPLSSQRELAESWDQGIIAAISATSG